MSNTEVITNGNTAWLVGPDTAISASGWANGPSFAELASLVNYSAGVKVDGSDWNVQASDQVEDRSFADQAGAKSRGPVQADGSIEVYTPGRNDTTSVEARTYDTITDPRVPLALGQRFVKPQGGAVAAGDEINVFRVITDARQHNRNDTTRTVGVGLVFQDDAWINYIAPASTPTAPVVTQQNAVSLTTLTAGKVAFLKVVYQGRNITAGAKYTSSDEAVFTVNANGVLVAIGIGTAVLKVTYPGSLAPADITVTVIAP